MLTDDQIHKALTDATIECANDARIATFIGWQDVHLDELSGDWVGVDPRGYHLDVPRYHRHIGAAWKVVEFMASEMDREYSALDNTRRLDWHGPLYKSVSKYLTQEGYPLGTTCWYVMVDHYGLREFICAKHRRTSYCTGSTPRH